MNRLRVLLVDDHNLVRAGIRALLVTIPGVEVVAEAGDGAQALELARTHQPDIVLMDISMKGMNGLEATQRLRKENPAARVIMLSMYATEDYVSQALRAGAIGYLLKDSATKELAQALETVARGETYLGSDLSAESVEQYMSKVGADGAAPDVLTARQREILQLIAEGHNTKEIAYRLGLSAKTVETHRAQIMERLGIRDIAGLVRYAIRNRMTSADG
jgi:DNA-binding NarL/FixJ family response regulator